MVPSEAERLATIEQVLRDVRDDVHELRLEQREDHHRLRAVEGTVVKIVEAARITQERRDYQLRQLGVRIQWLTLAVAVGSFALGAVVSLLAH